MIAPDPSFKIRIRKQRPTPLVQSAHSLVSNPASSVNHSKTPNATDFFNSLLSGLSLAGFLRLPPRDR
jgi:hypothetical protein